MNREITNPPDPAPYNDVVYGCMGSFIRFFLVVASILFYV